MEHAIADLIRDKIRTIPNFPKPGIMFRDITTLLKDPEGMAAVTQAFQRLLKNTQVDAIAGIESRGFIIGAALAGAMKKGFIPLRKPGKLPFKTVSYEYELEYGRDTLEIHEDAVFKGENVVVVDDLVATGGTMDAACRLIEKVGGVVSHVLFVIDLPDLGGRQRIAHYPNDCLVAFEGE